MPSRTVRTTITVDNDLIDAAREKSRAFDRHGEVNLSAYINSLLREDLGLALKRGGLASQSGARPKAEHSRELKAVDKPRSRIIPRTPADPSD